LVGGGGRLVGGGGGIRAGTDDGAFCGGGGSDDGSFAVDAAGVGAGVCETAITFISILNANCMKNCNEHTNMHVNNVLPIQCVLNFLDEF